jgi:ankyrin repeat protein
MVDALLAAGPELDVFEASAVGDVVRLRTLLDADPSQMNAYATDGFFPLALAAFFGQPEAVRLLLERGADVTATARNPMRVQALHSAVAGRNREAVRLLVEAGADPNVHQHGGWTPLQGAAAHGDDEIVDVLLARGADPTATNDDGKDAAALARENGHDSLADRLAAAQSASG